MTFLDRYWRYLVLAEICEWSDEETSAYIAQKESLIRAYGEVK